MSAVSEARRPRKSRAGAPLLTLRWPALSRRLLVSSGVILVAYLAVAVLVQVRRFDPLDFRLLHYLQSRGSFAQDVALGVLSYAGALEVTVAIALLLAVPLFKGLRLLAIVPAVLLLLGTGLEVAGKHVITNAPPNDFYHRVPDFLPRLGTHTSAGSFPSGHMLRGTILYGLVMYLAERWQLFGRDTSRLSPVLLLVIILLGYALIYVGAHWFSDVLGGTLLGLALLIGLIAYLERKRLVSP